MLDAAGRHVFLHRVVASTRRRRAPSSLWLQLRETTVFGLERTTHVFLGNPGRGAELMCGQDVGWCVEPSDDLCYRGETAQIRGLTVHVW